MTRRELVKTTMGALFGVSIIPAFGQKPVFTPPIIPLVWPEMPDLTVYFTRRPVNGGHKDLEIMSKPQDCPFDELGLTPDFGQEVISQIDQSIAMTTGWEKDGYLYTVHATPKNPVFVHPSGVEWTNITP